MKKWQYRLHSVIYEADTPAGKLFDILLLITILLSVVFVALESVASIDANGLLRFCFPLNIFYASFACNVLGVIFLAFMGLLT